MVAISQLVSSVIFQSYIYILYRSFQSSSFGKDVNGLAWLASGTHWVPYPLSWHLISILLGVIFAGYESWLFLRTPLSFFEHADLNLSRQLPGYYGYIIQAWTAFFTWYEMHYPSVEVQSFGMLTLTCWKFQAITDLFQRSNPTEVVCRRHKSPGFQLGVDRDPGSCHNHGDSLFSLAISGHWSANQE